MLDAGTFDKIKRGFNFNDDINIIRTLIDWPELVIRLGWILNKEYQRGSAL